MVDSNLSHFPIGAIMEVVDLYLKTVNFISSESCQKSMATNMAPSTSTPVLVAIIPIGSKLT